MTHLVSSEDPADPINALQQHPLRRHRPPPFPGVPTSLANSSGPLPARLSTSNLARPGAALYGINPTPGASNPMRPTVRLRARVLQLRTIQPGDSVGYNATWRATRPTRIATAGIGYADGYPRSLSNRGAAFFDGAPSAAGRPCLHGPHHLRRDGRARPRPPGDWLDLIGPAPARRRRRRRRRHQRLRNPHPPRPALHPDLRGMTHPLDAIALVGRA
jgi:alanine racemase